jgi:exodeoxyribonuclease-3
VLKPFRLASWNVNGIRAILKRGSLQAFVDQLEPDILALQETKVDNAQTPFDVLDYPFQYWHGADKKGYSGTALLSRIEPLAVRYDFPEGCSDHPSEGRIITAEFNAFYLINCYVPNARRDLVRLNYRVNAWDCDFRTYLTELARHKPLIVCGDFNVAHQPIDLANPNTNRRNAGFTDEERESFSQHLASGLVDIFRTMYPDKTGAYTWWTYRSGARERNVGWRIDYFLISGPLRDHVQAAPLYPEWTGSDHCPVGLDLLMHKI